MSANLDTSTGRPAIAFTGSRDDIWHRMGTAAPDAADLIIPPGETWIDVWARMACLDWEAIKVPAIAELSSLGMQQVIVDGWNHVVRSDTGHPLGYVSDRWQPVQPRQVLGQFDRYVSVDPRFRMSVAGALGRGETIWATAVFNGGMKVAGEAHAMHLLMTTTFDGTGATINRATATRVVCQNTLNISHKDRRTDIRTRHNTRFDGDRVARELAQVVASFDEFKAMGDAMADISMTKEQTIRFFGEILDISPDAKAGDISTRKMGQFRDMLAAYGKSVNEGAPDGSQWAALQAVTRYVDHTRGTRGGEGDEAVRRFQSANFGTGAQLKTQAMALLQRDDDAFRSRKSASETAAIVVDPDYLARLVQ